MTYCCLCTNTWSVFRLMHRLHCISHEIYIRFAMLFQCQKWGDIFTGPTNKSVFNRKTALWRHQMEAFSALLAIWAGNSPVPGEFPAQRPVTRIFDIFFDLRPNKRLSKQLWCWWFETLSSPLWRRCNVCDTSVPDRPHLKQGNKAKLYVPLWQRHNVYTLICGVK